MSSTHHSPKAKEGSVHGRFQPPHNGHREYILAAKKLCDFLWIGITRYDLTKHSECDVAPHRADPRANPLTYFERTTLLSRMLLAEGVSAGSFGFLPFPIDEPMRLEQFVPTSVVCFTTVYEPWNREKIRLLEQKGYTVNVLWERSLEEKEFSGSRIRESMRRRDREWEDHVPAAILQDLKATRIEQRVV